MIKTLIFFLELLFEINKSVKKKKKSVVKHISILKVSTDINYEQLNFLKKFFIFLLY